MPPGFEQFLRRIETKLREAEKREDALIEVLRGLVAFRAELQAFKPRKRRKSK